jgi:hypothetical protein
MTQRMTPALGTFAAPTVTAFVLFFSLVLWILALRSDIHFSYSSHLPSGPCNIQSHTVLPPSLCMHTICTQQSHSHDTHTHILYSTHHACVDILCIHTFSILLYHSLISRSVLHSLFPVRSDRFALIIVFFLLPRSVLSVFPLRSCFCH